MLQAAAPVQTVAMTTASAPRILLAAVAVVAAVGAFDAAIGRTWDLVALFGVLVVLGLAGLGWSLGQRRPVTLRVDHAAALRSRSQATGEPLDQLLDRSVATYLAALADPVPDGRAAEQGSHPG